MKITSKQVYKKLLIIGGILITISILLAFITLFRVYGKAGEDLDAVSLSSLERDQMLVNIALWFRGIGIAAIIAGLILFVVDQRQGKKH